MQNVLNWEPELKKLRSIIALPEFKIATKWGAEVFTFNGKNVVSYGGFKNHFALWFYNGVFLKDTHQVLVTASQRKTKSLRQWRFTSMDEIHEDKIIAYLHEAIEIERNGLKIPAERKIDLLNEGILKTALASDQLFYNCFNKLTPGKRREYQDYIDSAKKEQTKQSRLEKITPMVMQGIGLNDKYKK
jgi:uncharacterized protein YdeI (YjbR/CyaY-like superfamily)